MKNLIKNKMIDWSLAYLISHGYQLKNNLPEIVQIRPWSLVVRFDTSSGFIYLKQTPKQIALEPIITTILHEQFSAPVPEVIASESGLNCFLMKDAGMPLRELLKKNFDVALLCKAVDAFTTMQLTASQNTNVLIDAGVPDFQLNQLADLFNQLILKNDILLSDGMTEKEIDVLTNFVPVVSDLCKKLSTYQIPETLVQPDFNDNNIMIDVISKKITFIDLGEIVISHPFFSLIKFLQQIKKHHVLTEDHIEYQHIQTACFKNFLQFESYENVLSAFELTKRLFPVYDSLAYYRLMEACDKAKLVSFYGVGRLRDLLLRLK